MIYLIVERFWGWIDAHGLDKALRIFWQLQFRALAAAFLAFLIVILLGRRTIAYLVRKKIGDTGLSDAEALRRHSAGKANTPTMGGVLIAGAIGVSVLLLADISNFYVLLGLVVLGWLAVLGGFDDWLKLTARTRGSGSRQGLHAWEKLAFQLGLGLLVGYFVYQHAPAGSLAHALNLPFQRTYIPGGLKASTGMAHLPPNPHLFYLPMGVFVGVAMLMVSGMSNAVNITDGMDGLASGISTAVALGLVLLALIAGDDLAAQTLLVPHVEESGELAVLAGAMAGACLGFLWWNCSPAQVFMGDTGSLCLGGLIGYTAVVIRQEAAVLLMCGVFLWEILSVAMQVGYFKWTKGKRIFRCAPYHHHLHLGGWTEQQVVARAWIVSILLVVGALALIKAR